MEEISLSSEVRLLGCRKAFFNHHSLIRARLTGVRSLVGSPGVVDRSHETMEPAAAARVAAGSSGIMPEPVSGLVGSTGLEQATSQAVNLQIASGCDAKCDALPADRVELLAKAVVLAAGMAVPEVAREAVLRRVIDDLSRGC